VKYALIAIAALALTACAAPQSGTWDQSAAQPSDPLGKFLADIHARTLVDAQAAKADADSHNDVIAISCWTYIATKMESSGATPSTQIAGILSAFQKARDIRRGIGSGVSDEFKLACSPLVLEEINQVGKLALSLPLAVKP
jgi:hypothetical protein